VKLIDISFFQEKILEILSQSTLIAMMEDLIIPDNPGEYLNYIQEELLQGSACSGMYAPKGSILITSHEPEVKRLASLIWNIYFLIQLNNK